MDNSVEICLPLERSEWDFASVTDEELIACCLWEYARESLSFQITAWIHAAGEPLRRVVPNLNEPFDGKRYDKFRRKQDKAIADAKRCGFDFKAFLDRFYEYDHGCIRFFHTIKVLRRAELQAVARYSAWLKGRSSRGTAIVSLCAAGALEYRRSGGSLER